MRVAAAAVACGLLAATLAGCQSGPATTMPTPPAGAVVVAVDQIRFLDARVEASAGVPFTVFFENRESLPHNLHMVSPSGATVLQTEIVTGPIAQLAELPALAAGAYALLCDLHPEMRAEFVAQ